MLPECHSLHIPTLNRIWILWTTKGKISVKKSVFLSKNDWRRKIYFSLCGTKMVEKFVYKIELKKKNEKMRKREREKTALFLFPLHLNYVSQSSHLHLHLHQFILFLHGLSFSLMRRRWWIMMMIIIVIIVLFSESDFILILTFTKVFFN